jgi:hypothetical protein
MIDRAHLRPDHPRPRRERLNVRLRPLAGRRERHQEGVMNDVGCGPTSPSDRHGGRLHRVSARPPVTIYFMGERVPFKSITR